MSDSDKIPCKSSVVDSLKEMWVNVLLSFVYCCWMFLSVTARASFNMCFIDLLQSSDQSDVENLGDDVEHIDIIECFRLREEVLTKLKKKSYKNYE